MPPSRQIWLSQIACRVTGISFGIAPTVEHAFFKQAEFECLFRYDLLQITGFTTQILHLVGVCRACGVAGQSLLALLSVTRTDGFPSAVHEVL